MLTWTTTEKMELTQMTKTTVYLQVKNLTYPTKKGTILLSMITISNETEAHQII